MDSFKGTLTARQACEATREGLLRTRPHIDVVLQPMADGGEGTVDVLLQKQRGEWIPVETKGPLFNQTVQAGYGWLAGKATALIEMASANGLTLLPVQQRDPLKTTTYGTGQLIRHARDNKAKRILLAVGGSATVDGGVGTAMALGWQFLDAHHRPIGPGGGALKRLKTLIPPPKTELPPIEVLCDVSNPLCGKNGAAAVFGPQKGATPAAVQRLEAGLRQLTHVVAEQLQISIDSLPGGGGGGGLAAGAVAFMQARLISGIETVIRSTQLKASLENADWLLTGEGRLDASSLQGKVVSGMLKIARQTDTKVAVIAGKVALENYQKEGILAALALEDEGDSAYTTLVATSQQFAQHYLG